jgi:hypothetical protein
MDLISSRIPNFHYSPHDSSRSGYELTSVTLHSGTSAFVAIGRTSTPIAACIVIDVTAAGVFLSTNGFT